MSDGTNTPADRRDGGFSSLLVEEISISAHVDPGAPVQVKLMVLDPGHERFRVTFGNRHRRVTVYLPEDVAVQLLARLGVTLYGTPEQADDAPAAQS